jgi:antitoxin (DNA-binding transcriptional repressor) of toxin-antitoxin stability system
VTVIGYDFEKKWRGITYMPQMKFLSLSELQQQKSGIKDILDDDGKIIITGNGKPIGLMVGISEDSFEEVLEDWKKVRQLKRARTADRQPDETDMPAASSGDEGTDEE